MAARPKTIRPISVRLRSAASTATTPSPGTTKATVYLSPKPRPAHNPAAAKPGQLARPRGPALTLSRLNSEPSTNNEVVRSLVDVPSRPTNPAPDTPINQAVARSVARSTA